MPQVLRGTTIPLEQRFTEDFSPVNGVSRSIEWKSFDRAQIQAYADRYAQQGCAYNLDVVHGIATLVATDNSGNFTIDIWEVGVSDILVSSLKNPRNLAAIGDDNLLVIARALRDGSTLGDAVTSLDSDAIIDSVQFADPFQFNGPTNEIAAAQRLYGRMLSGSDSFFFPQYILRHTTNVSNRYDINVSDVGVNQIYTPAKLISEATNANSWIFPLPPRLVFKLNAVILETVPRVRLDDASGIITVTPSNYMWGWLKSASPESTAPYDRVNIVTEYKLFLWSTDEYGAF